MASEVVPLSSCNSVCFASYQQATTPNPAACSFCAHRLPKIAAMLGGYLYILSLRYRTLDGDSYAQLPPACSPGFPFVSTTVDLPSPTLSPTAAAASCFVTSAQGSTPVAGFD